MNSQSCLPAERRTFHGKGITEHGIPGGHNDHSIASASTTPKFSAHVLGRTLREHTIAPSWLRTRRTLASVAPRQDFIGGGARVFPGRGTGIAAPAAQPTARRRRRCRHPRHAAALALPAASLAPHSDGCSADAAGRASRGRGPGKRSREAQRAANAQNGHGAVRGKVACGAGRSSTPGEGREASRRAQLSPLSREGRLARTFSPDVFHPRAERSSIKPGMHAACKQRSLAAQPGPRRRGTQRERRRGSTPATRKRACARAPRVRLRTQRWRRESLAAGEGAAAAAAARDAAETDSFFPATLAFLVAGVKVPAGGPVLRDSAARPWVFPRRIRSQRGHRELETLLPSLPLPFTPPPPPPAPPRHAAATARRRD